MNTRWLPFEESISFQRIRVPVVGDVYEFLVDIECRSGAIHKQGSLLTILEETDEAPFHEVGPFFKNWVCKTEQDTSVWATLESCIERGELKLVKEGSG